MKIWKKMRKAERKFDRLFGNIGTLGLRKRLESADGKLENYRKAWANFYETEREFVINVEIPGVEKENIKLDITDSGIEIRAEKKQLKKEVDKEKGIYNFSKSYAGFARVIDLPEEADLDKVDAIYRNGILTIKVARKNIKIKKEKEIRIS